MAANQYLALRFAFVNRGIPHELFIIIIVISISMITNIISDERPYSHKFNLSPVCSLGYTDSHNLL